MNLRNFATCEWQNKSFGCGRCNSLLKATGDLDHTGISHDSWRCIFWFHNLDFNRWRNWKPLCDSGVLYAGLQCSMLVAICTVSFQDRPTSSFWLYLWYMCLPFSRPLSPVCSHPSASIASLVFFSISLKCASPKSGWAMYPILNVAVARCLKSEVNWHFSIVLIRVSWCFGRESKFHLPRTKNSHSQSTFKIWKENSIQNGTKCRCWKKGLGKVHQCCQGQALLDIPSSCWYPHCPPWKSSHPNQRLESRKNPKYGRQVCRLSRRHDFPQTRHQRNQNSRIQVLSVQSIFIFTRFQVVLLPIASNCFEKRTCHTTREYPIPTIQSTPRYPLESVQLLAVICSPNTSRDKRWKSFSMFFCYIYIYLMLFHSASYSSHIHLIHLTPPPPPPPSHHLTIAPVAANFSWSSPKAPLILLKTIMSANV